MHLSYINARYTFSCSDTKGIIRKRKSKKNRQHNRQHTNIKQKSAKHYTENVRLSSMKPH